MTKLIIVVNIPYKLLYVILSKPDKQSSWPYLISKFLITYNHLQFTMLLLINLALFTARLFLLSISLLS